MANYAFIDGQNLHLATTKADDPWRVDYRRFRVYLNDKYHVSHAHYFIGAYDTEHEDLYDNLRESGFILSFRDHSITQTGHKKGNVDADIVFETMRSLYEREHFDKVILVSGDGDYKRMVSWLIEIGRFGKILLPSSKNASSLYRKLHPMYYSYLDYGSVKKKIRK